MCPRLEYVTIVWRADLLQTKRVTMVSWSLALLLHPYGVLVEMQC
jgi:hypothetical protein